jgi:DNA recombination protein RmuC
MGDHVKGMGAAMGQAISRYNSFVGSYESQVLVQARRFESLKVDHEGKELAELTPIETGVRPMAKLAADGVVEPVRDLLSDVEPVAAEPARRKLK